MIGFLHPWVLFGLAAAAIPVLLHLLARREPPTVLFPAVRYLVTTTREHQRRLKLQNLLLLLLRTLLIVLVVLAAAAPTLPVSGVPGHAPSALVLILDNSPSSGAVSAGAPQLRQLMAAGRSVLARATPEDVLWLITADGIPRRGDRRTLGDLLGGLTVSSQRLDLGAALTLAGQVLAPEPRPGEIVLLSDLQSSALSGADLTVPLTVGRPGSAVPRNIGIGAVDPGAQPWSSAGGRLSLALVGDSGSSVPVSARLGDRPARQTLGRVGVPTSLTIPGSTSGWATLTAELDPDELRVDDRRVAAVRVAPVARVAWDSTSSYAAAACEVLASNRRIVRGQEVTLGRLGRGTSIVEPPEDPAQLGALNRALAARGVGWSFGSLSIQPISSDSGPVIGSQRILRRYTLRPTQSGRTGILATAGGTPWIVRGGDVVLIGSRLDPGWSELPVSPAFMPFMDVLLNRLSRGELALETGAPGDPIVLPDRVSSVHQGKQEWRVEGGAVFRPAAPGIYFLEAGGDTVGAISVNPDPRESRLGRAGDSQVRQLWRGARVVGLDRVGGAAFSSAAQGDLRGPMLWTALVVGLVEVAFASGWRRRA
jgi:Aerotolerance regulator N-terminal